MLPSAADEEAWQVCASGVGYYGFDTGDMMVDEAAGMGSGFLASEVLLMPQLKTVHHMCKAC